MRVSMDLGIIGIRLFNNSEHGNFLCTEKFLQPIGQSRISELAGLITFCSSAGVKIMM